MSDDIYKAIKKPIDDKLRARIVELWQRQNPGAVPQIGSPLTITVDWRDLAAIADELARNAAQGIVLLPADACSLDWLRDAFLAGLSCGESGDIARYGNGDYAKGCDEAANEYVELVAPRAMVEPVP